MEACGTFRANHVGLQTEMKTLKKKKGEMPNAWFNSKKDILAFSWVSKYGFCSW